MTTVEGDVRTVLHSLHREAIPERREKARSYTPSALEVLGVPVPAIRREVRRLAKAYAATPGEEVLALAQALLATGTHEARQVAYEVVGGRGDVIRDLDGAAVEALGAGNDNWASVDCFSVYVAGPAWRDGRVGDDDVRRWAASADRWWRRTALVATVPLNMKSRGGTGDPRRTLEMCALLAGDAEPLVAKALSWALRALVPVAPDQVRSFLQRHGDGMPALARREVGNKLATGRKGARP